jgi:hypothetical protein
MIDLLRQTVVVSIWFGFCAWAIGRGRAPERIHGAMHLVGAILTPIVQYNIGRQGAELGVFAVDVVVLAIGAFVALRWDRWWAMFAAAFLLLQVMVHVVRLFNLAADQFYYASTAMFWSFSSLFAMAFGMGQIELARLRAWSASGGARHAALTD